MRASELRDHFLDILNRDDCDAALADTFLDMGLTRASRILRTPIQEREASLIVDDDFDGFIDIPDDFLVGIGIEVDGTPLNKITSGQRDLLTGYIQQYRTFELVGNVVEGQEIVVHYYGDAYEPNWEAGTDIVPINGAIPMYRLVPDLVIYLSLVYACNYFIDERATRFESQAASLALEIKELADEAVMGGGTMVVTPYGGGIA